MKSIINYVLLAATIFYGNTDVLAAPITISQLVPRQIDGVLGSRELLMYNGILNARTSDAHSIESRESHLLYPREPKKRDSDLGMPRDERQDYDKAKIHQYTTHPGPMEMVRPSPPTRSDVQHSRLSYELSKMQLNTGGK